MVSKSEWDFAKHSTQAMSKLIAVETAKFFENGGLITKRLDGGKYQLINASGTVVKSFDTEHQYQEWLNEGEESA